MSRSLVLALLLAVAACQRGAPVDLDGNRVDPLATRAPATVLVFVATTCPIANRYAPELQRIYDQYRPRGVEMYLVYAEAAEPASAVRAHRTQYRLAIPALRDPAHRLVRWARATTAPEAAVFSHGALVYHGRIDDRFVDLGRERPAATRHDLADAIDAALANRAPPEAEAPAVGCAL